MEAAQYLSTHAAQSNLLTRPLLGDILSHSSQVEEILDAYGARNNQQWQPFRSLVAAIKLYSNVGYELLHVQKALSAYQLLPLQRDFRRATFKPQEFAELFMKLHQSHAAEGIFLSSGIAAARWIIAAIVTPPGRG